MKKVFIKLAGIFLLTVFSLFYTNRLINISKSKDILMQEIKTKANNYTKTAIEATIQDNRIIPGLKGVIVDINQSYNNMKKLGVFNEKFLIYNPLLPEITLKDNYDKYIIRGNSNKKAIAIVFKINSNNNIEEILSILNQLNTKATFFIDGKWAEENIDVVKKISKNHQLANLGYNDEYDTITILYTNSIINKFNNTSNLYCYLEKENIEVLKTCKNKQMWTIIPNIIDSSLHTIKSNLKNGSIITLNNNSEISVIVKYIQQKGYELVTLDELLEE